MDERLVYDVRVKIGAILAEEHPLEADTVTPVPDSGITFAIGYHQRSNIKYRECLMKNRYIGRTFIMPGQELREIAVRLKMNTIRPNIEGNRIIMVDDSIVRGTPAGGSRTWGGRRGQRRSTSGSEAPPSSPPATWGSTWRRGRS
jgi:amidophosphoribosyltransferase